jgi:amino-acid N-acetyltransferase
VEEEARDVDEVIIRKATVADTAPIMALVNGLAAQQLMLPRSPAAIVENIRDFTVAEVGGELAGCGSLHVVWTDLAEIRSLAVRQGDQHRGLGTRIVAELIEEAQQLGVAKLFAFTYVQAFFEKCGFHVVEHATLPHKVFGDCLNCPKFNSCDEIAMVRVLRETPESAEPQRRGPLSLPLGTLPLPRIKL